jgi:hypothetical protein
MGDVDEFGRHWGSCQGSIEVLLVKGAGHAADVEGRAVRGDPARAPWRHVDSAWSYAGDPSACYFVYDRTYPKAPKITSAEYPESIYTADLTEPWYDGVGQYGSFTIDAVDTDVTTYWYGINENPTSRNKITTSGGAAEIVKALPAEPGVRFFTARAFDSAGNPGTTYTYQFRVKVGQPDRAT